MKNCKRLQICIILLSSLWISNVFANIFAAHVQLEFDGTFPATIRYRLNENATAVTVFIKQDQNVVRTLTGVGDQLTRSQEASIQWDGLLDSGEAATEGVYTVEIEAVSNGHTVWTVLSDRFDTERRQPYVRGVVANKNNGSINFGRVYVIQQHTGSAGAGQYRPRGIWLYRNDLSFWGGSQETAYASGNFYSSISEYCDVSLWCSSFETETLESITDYSDSNGPFRLAIDPADYVYVSTSLEDALGGITVADADFSKESVFFLLNRLPVTRYGQDPTEDPLHFCCYEENIWTTDSLVPYDTYGVTRNHGLCSGMWIDGVGTKRVLYVCDAIDWNGYMDQTWGRQQVVKFTVGDHVERGLTYRQNPEVILPNSVSRDATKIQFDAQGNLFVGGAYNSWPGFTEYRSLQKFHPEGDAYVLDWERIQSNTIQTMSIAYDPRSNRLAMSDFSAPGYIRIINTETGAIDENISFWVNALQNNDIDFDAAGNILGANRAMGQVICLSPPDGLNSFVTRSGYAFRVGGDAGVIISKVGRPDPGPAPVAVNLTQNYPNPFNPITMIQYQLPEDSPVSLTIHNLLGEKIRTLVSHELQTSGHHQVMWNGMDDNDRLVSSGIYIYRIRAGRFTATRKMTFTK